MNKREELFGDINDPRERALAERIEENFSELEELEPPPGLWMKIAARIEAEDRAPSTPPPEEIPAPAPIGRTVAPSRWKWLALPAFGFAACVAMAAYRSGALEALRPGDQQTMPAFRASLPVVEPGQELLEAHLLGRVSSNEASAATSARTASVRGSSAAASVAGRRR